MEKFEITLKGYAALEKEVTKNGNIYVPRAWIGKRVKIILLEDVPIKTKE